MLQINNLVHKKAASDKKSESVTIKTKEGAYVLLMRLGATKRLITHLQLVGEAAESLIIILKQLSVPFDDNFVTLGVAIHDAGKIAFPGELDGSGSSHEPEGENYYLKTEWNQKLLDVA